MSKRTAKRKRRKGMTEKQFVEALENDPKFREEFERSIREVRDSPAFRKVIEDLDRCTRITGEDLSTMVY